MTTTRTGKCDACETNNARMHNAWCEVCQTQLQLCTRCAVEYRIHSEHPIETLTCNMCEAEGKSIKQLRENYDYSPGKLGNATFVLRPCTHPSKVGLSELPIRRLMSPLGAKKPLQGMSRRGLATGSDNPRLCHFYRFPYFTVTDQDALSSSLLSHVLT